MKKKENNGGDISLKVGKATLKLTNQQKIFWPKEGYTKGDLVQYYGEMAAVMLPYLKNRPESMNRFPNGIKGPGFYQKDVNTAQIPGWLKTKKMYSESIQEDIDYLICNDKETLMYMANLGCIEINPWNSRITKPEHPDWMVIDLDPVGIGFEEVVKVALEVRKFTEEIGAATFPKTSGATGIHIYLPMGAKYEYEIVRAFAKRIAEAVHERIPEITSVERNPKKRTRKVYLDYLQNSKGQTLAAPYSVRPRPGATVSTPLEWGEVNGKLDPGNYTIKTIFKRLDKKGDLWKGLLGSGVNLREVVKRL